MVLDYAIKDVTAMVYSTIDEAADMIRNPKYELCEVMKSFIKSRINNYEANMKKMSEILIKLL